MTYILKKGVILLALKISTRDAIFKILYHIQVKYNRTYSQVKRSSIKNLLWRIYKTERCLSTVDYHLGELNKHDLINVYTRRGRNSDGTFYNKVSNRQIIGKGLNYLKMLGVNIRKYLIRWAFQGVKHKRHKDKPHRLNDDNSIKQPSGRSAAQFETLENVLSDTLIRPV